jgi:hypothetical protein
VVVLCEPAAARSCRYMNRGKKGASEFASSRLMQERLFSRRRRRARSRRVAGAQRNRSFRPEKMSFFASCEGENRKSLARTAFGYLLVCGYVPGVSRFTTSGVS